MSRLTAAQVIGLGEYLNPDFNPASLTVSQLLGVLGFHNIIFPTPYTKGKLIQLFNDEIKPNTTKFKRERVKREQSIASDDGITDGITGKPISEKVRCFARDYLFASDERIFLLFRSLSKEGHLVGFPVIQQRI